MSTTPRGPFHSPSWRRASSAIALVAALAMALRPPVLMAQTPGVDVPALPPAVDSGAPAPDQPPDQPKPAPKPKKVVAHRHTATDNVSDELNRRETARAQQVAEQLQAQASGSATATPAQTSSPVAAPIAAPGAAPAGTAMPLAAIPASGAPPSAPTAESKPADGQPPAVPAIPPRSPIVSASLTPTALTPQAAPAAVPAAVPPGSVSSLTPTAPVPSTVPATSPQQQVQTQPPVPIQPPPLPASPPISGDVPTRPFAQSQLVPTQQPTLNLEINKGTALRLPGPASTVFVAAPDIADVQVKSPGMIYVFAKKAGDTVLYAVDAQDRVLLNTIVHVTSPVSRMKAALDAAHPGNAVNFDNQADTIVLSGVVRSAVVAEDARRLALAQVNNDARKVFNNIRVDAPTQVQLRVKIAEVDRQSLKRVGINWQNINNIALFGLVPTVSAGFAVQTVQSTGGAASGAVALQTSGGLNGFIDLLATQNKATVLAEPNLIAMSGETASFLAGGEVPVITPQAGLTGSTIAVQYQPYGVSLAFTPTIVGDRINLKVAPEVSQLSTTGAISVPLTATSTVTIPALLTRKASTTVELGTGQSFAIAGLLQQTGEQDVVKIPWLGDVPVLGTLFKSDAYQRQETELVIIVTPYFVEPTSEPLRTPFTGLVPPTDVDRLLLQRLNHPTPPTTVPTPPVPYPGSPQASIPAAGFKLN